MTTHKEIEMLTRREALMGTVFAAAAVAVIPSLPAMASAKDVAGLPREKITLSLLLSSMRTIRSPRADRRSWSSR